MEKGLKKPKSSVYPHVLFGSSVIATCILKHLPPISKLAMFKAFPHILEKGWTTNGQFIDDIYARLKKKVHPTLFNKEWVYTGSMLMEVLLGETFGNGKRDVDIYLCTGFNRSQMSGFDTVQPRTTYAETFTLKSDGNIVLDVLDPVRVEGSYNFVTSTMEVDFKKSVQRFDIDCCKNCITPNVIYIAKPFDLLTRCTRAQASGTLAFHMTYKHSVEHTIDVLVKRCQKYSERGFKIEICHKTKDEIKKVLARHCMPPNTIDKWIKLRPNEGIFIAK